MPHTTPTQQPPVRCALPHLKRIAADEQEIAQGELDQYIADQAEAIAPEPLTTVEINFYHHEIYCGKQLIAYIAYDHSEFVTQPWLVMVNGEEKFRDTTVARCQRFIEWHHKDGTLNPFALTEVPEVPTITEISFYDQEALVNGELVASISFDSENHENLYWRVLVNDVEIFRDTTSARCHSYVKQQYQQGTLPVQKPFEEPCSTENEIITQIFNECEKCGLELLDDGIYHNNVKLGRVGCTDGNWWIILSSCGQQQYSGSVSDAVRRLCPSQTSLLEGDVVGDAKVADCEQLLDLPFEELTAEDWQRLQAYKPVQQPQLAAA